MKSLKGKILVIPDIHQRIDGFAQPILDREEAACDHIVFLGDFFDCFKAGEDGYVSFKKTCLWVNETYERLGKKAIWLIGNHDCAYVSGFYRKPAAHWCSGVTISKRNQFKKYINPDWLRSLELCVWANGWLLSHAGLQYDHFRPLISEKANVEELYTKWENEKVTFHADPHHWIWDVGRCRGGMSRVGSPIWCDASEFVPIPEIKQIVGHTSAWDKPRSKGNNFCIDCMQTWYAVVEENGLIFKNVLDGESIIHTF